jgi:hypothetical protein
MLQSCRIVSSRFFLVVPGDIRRFNLSMSARWKPRAHLSSTDSRMLVQQGRPQKAGQFARAGDHRLRGRLPVRQQVTLAPIPPVLSLVREGDHGRWLPLATRGERGTETRRMPIVPRRLDDHPPRVTIARLGDAPAARSLRAGVLAGHQAHVRHQVGMPTTLRS